MLSAERDREANSFGVEASLPPKQLPRVGIPRSARNDTRETFWTALVPKQF